MTRARRAELRRDDADLVLATLHGTKGLEFDHVACIGWTRASSCHVAPLKRRTTPFARSRRNRGLSYVAWTRARTSLLLVYDPYAPSIFMGEAVSEAELRVQGAAKERRAA